MSHAFISYVRENSNVVDRLAIELRESGIETWLDRENIMPGLRWKDAIRTAIAEGAFFIACFSKEYLLKTKTFMNEEITLAIDELRQRHTHRAWFIPVKLTSCDIPDRTIGGGESLRDIQFVELYKDWDEAIEKIVYVIKSTNNKRTELNQKGNLLTIDSRPLLDNAGEIWQTPYEQFSDVSSLLDHIYFKLAPNIPSYSYGDTWLLRDTESGKRFRDMGQQWAMQHKMKKDDRTLKDVEILPGMKLEVF